MVESFSNEVPTMSQMAHVLRECFSSKQEVYEKGIGFVRNLWESVTAD
jgi:hypothetical protein